MRWRLLRVLNRFNIGGPTHNAVYLSHYLQDEFDTLLVGAPPEPGEASSYPWARQWKVKALLVEWWRRPIRPWQDLAAAWKMRRLIQHWQPTIVHTHAAKAGFVGRLAAAGYPILRVHTYHGHVFDGYFNPVLAATIRATERFLASVSDAIIAISQKQKDELVHRFGIAPAHKVHVIRLGFPLERFRQVPAPNIQQLRERLKLHPHRRRVALIGRLAPIKQPERFIQAVAPLVKQYNVQALLVGDGTPEMMQHLRIQARRYGLTLDRHSEADVYVTGYVEDIAPLYPLIDFVVLTSRNEGTPVSLIEAQAAGCPVVSTDVGAVREAVAPVWQEFVVPDSAAQLMAAMRRVLTMSEEERTLRTHQAQQWVMQHYHVQRLVQEMRELYRELLKQKGFLLPPQQVLHKEMM